MQFLNLYRWAGKGGVSLALLLALSSCKGPWVKEFAPEQKAPNNAGPLIGPIPTLNLSATGGPQSISITLTDSDSNLSCYQAISTHSSNILVVPATYMAVSGTAPNCLVTITPAPGIVGQSQITLTVTDGRNTSATSFTVNSYGVPAANVTAVPVGTLGRAWKEFTVTGTGGLPPYTYSLSSGSLPAGVTINSTTGKVSGTPTAYGKFSSIIFRVNDAGGGTAYTAPFDLYVASYDLRFTESTTRPTGVTFVRKSSATRIGSTGLVETVGLDTERWEWASGVNKGVLIEDKRGNLFSLSERFEAPYYWTPSLLTLQGTPIAGPNGESFAQSFKETTGNGVHGFTSRAIAKAASDPLTFSVFLKPDVRTEAILRLSSGGNFAQVLCTLSGAGSVGSAASNGYSTPTAVITAMANGWYRCAMTTVSDASASVTAEVRLRNGTTDSYAGATANGLGIWGAQLETTALASSYVPARNLLTNSEAIDEFTRTNLSVAAESQTAPDSTLTADQLTDSVNNLGVASKGISIATSDDDYTVSVYVKKAAASGAAVVGIQADVTATVIFTTTYDAGIGIDPFTGNVKPLATNNSAATLVDSRREDAGAYWRVFFTIRMRASNNGVLRMNLYPAWAATLGSSASVSSANNATGTATFWGAQIEPAVSSLSSATYSGNRFVYYRRTNASERNADLMNFTISSGPYNSAEGTAVCGVNLDQSPANSAVAFAFTDNFDTNYVSQVYTSSSAAQAILTGGVAQPSLTRTGTSKGTFLMAGGYAYNSLGLALNGTTVGSSGTASMPSPDQLFLGRANRNNSFLGGHLRSFLYFNARVPNSVLPGLSNPVSPYGLY